MASSLRASMAPAKSGLVRNNCDKLCMKKSACLCMYTLLQEINARVN